MNVLPIVGSAGFYEFASPFDVKAENNVEYTCVAVRRISDYIANNEDPQKSIYVKNELPEQTWLDDLAENAYIATLQSRSGHYLEVPYRYISKYPSVNGVPYRQVMIGLTLPSIPVAQDLTSLETEIKSVAEASLGVTVGVKSVELSKAVIVPFEQHEQAKQARQAQINGRATIYARYVAQRDRADSLQARLDQLETYIKSTLP